MTDGINMLALLLWKNSYKTAAFITAICLQWLIWIMIIDCCYFFNLNSTGVSLSVIHLLGYAHLQKFYIDDSASSVLKWASES